MSQPIGLFDSGLGGLTVLKELRRAMPAEDFIYLGDTARTPYGTKGAETITRYASECAQFLNRFEIKALVVACNTASAVALPALRAAMPVPVIGAVEPAVRHAVRVSETGNVLVLATNGTIASGIYTRTFAEQGPRINVTSVACPLFVPLVENGLVHGSIVDQVIDLYLGTVDFSTIDTVLLGCTHYPFLRSALASYVVPNIKFVDSAEPIARELALLTATKGNAAHGTPGRLRYFVTDEVSRFNHLATQLLDGETVEAASPGEISGG